MLASLLSNQQNSKDSSQDNLLKLIKYRSEYKHQIQKADEVDQTQTCEYKHQIQKVDVSNLSTVT